MLLRCLRCRQVHHFWSFVVLFYLHLTEFRIFAQHGTVCVYVTLSADQIDTSHWIFLIIKAIIIAWLANTLSSPKIVHRILFIVLPETRVTAAWQRFSSISVRGGCVERELARLLLVDNHALHELEGLFVDLLSGFLTSDFERLRYISMVYEILGSTFCCF